MTTSGDRLPASEWPAASDWKDLSPLDRAAKYEAVAPATHAHFLAEDAALACHERRLAWANLGLRVAGLVLGAAVVGGMILLSWHAIDAGQSEQVKWIVGTPTVALAGVFVSGKAINARIGRGSRRGVVIDTGTGDTATAA